MDHDERRRFFRIDDVVAIHYEVMTDDEALEQQKSLRQERLGPRDRIMDSEKELQLLIDKLRIQNPEFARAIELLNIKFSILKDEMPRSPLRSVWKQSDHPGSQHQCLRSVVRV